MRYQRVLGVLAGVCLVLVFLGTRLYRLLGVPVFVDEAFHLERARWAAAGSIQTGAGLGKWLSIQLLGAWVRVFGDSLLAARTLSVAIGLLAGVIFAYTAGAIAADSRRVRILTAALLYVFVPYVVFYDRQALTDSTQMLFFTALILFCLRFTRDGMARDAYMVAAVLIVAPLFKLTGFLLFLAPPLIILLASPAGARRWRAARIAGPYLAAFVVATAFAILNLVFVARSETVGRTTLGTPATFLQAVARNLSEFTQAGSGLLSWPLLVTIIVAPALVWLLTNDEDVRGRTAALAAAGWSQVAVAALLYDTAYPRYLLPALAPLLLLSIEPVPLVIAAISHRSRITEPMAAVLVIGVLLVTPALGSIMLLSHPENFPLAPLDRWQYYGGWPSGYGSEQIAAALERGAGAGAVTVIAGPQVWELGTYRAQLGDRVSVRSPEWGTSSIASAAAASLESTQDLYIVFDLSVTTTSAPELEGLRRRYAIDEITRVSRLDGGGGLVLWRISRPKTSSPSGYQ